MGNHSDTHAAHAGHAHDEHHVHGGPKLYAQILAALLCLTVITVWVARHPFDNNTVNIIVALAIASVKASLVGLFFMHLRWDSAVNSFLLVGSFFFVGLLILFCLADFSTREEMESVTYKAPDGIGRKTDDEKKANAFAFGQKAKGDGAHGQSGAHSAGEPAKH